MKKSYKIGLLSILLLLLLSTYFLFNIFYQEDINTLDIKTDIQISAEVLLDSYDANEDLANATFVEKVIEVEGEVKEVNFLNKRYTVLLQGENHKVTSIMCDMQMDQIEKVTKIKPGQTIKLKGVFKGFLKDAILLNCILLNDNHQ